jgi:hypothetical protein
MMILQVKYGGNRRTGFIWLRTATSDELFMNTVIIFKFPKRREILLDDRQLASKEGLCSAEVVNTGTKLTQMIPSPGIEE